MRLRLIRKKEVYRPTLVGYAVLFLLLAALGGPATASLYRFLASGHPVERADFVVVEGWLPDDLLKAVVRGPILEPHTTIIATGGPIPLGQILSEYGDYASMTRARLQKLGVPEERVIAVPAPPTHRDRTYASAMALKAFFDQQGVREARLNLVTRGVHARRSASLFRAALGRSFEVGVWVLPEEFDAQSWWRSSLGFRAVLYEVLAWGYTQLFWLLRPGAAP